MSVNPVSVVGAVAQVQVVKEKPSIDSITQMRRMVLESAQQSPASIEQKVLWLGGISQTISQIRLDSESLAKEANEQLEALPFFHYIRLCDKIGLHFLCEDIGRAKICISRTRKDLDRCIHKITKHELAGLAKMKNLHASSSMAAVQVYDMIGKLNPHTSLHLEGLADCLLSQRAFFAAARTYATFLQSNPSRKECKLKEIQAMVGAQEYSQAIQEIQEAKISLFPPEDGRNLPFRDTLDGYKADCLVELKRYEEARKVLLTLLKPDQLNEGIKQKLVLVAFHEEMSRYDNAEVGDEPLFSYSKKMFGQLPSYIQGGIAWSKDCFISDFEFWIFAACHNKVSKNHQMHESVLQRIEHFIQSALVSPQYILKSILIRAQRVDNDAKAFLQRYHQFAQETRGPIAAVAMAIVEARKTALRESIFGADSMAGSGGLQHTLDTFGSIVEVCKRSNYYNDPECKITLQQIHDLLSQTTKAIATCKESLVATALEGSHPYINLDSLPFIAPLLIAQ